MSLVEALTNSWKVRWPECRPVGHELRQCAGDRWIRFHSFPDLQRYPQTNDDVASMLRRHNMVLADLVSGSDGVGTSSGRLVVVTCSWSSGSEPSPRDAELIIRMPNADYWRSISLGDPGFDSWIHLWVSETFWTPGVVDPLLELVATDGTGDVIVAEEELGWLYHPYDGGADLIARSSRERDLLADRHPRWISPRPDGL